MIPLFSTVYCAACLSAVVAPPRNGCMHGRSNKLPDHLTLTFYTSVNNVAKLLLPHAAYILQYIT